MFVRTKQVVYDGWKNDVSKIYFLTLNLLTYFYKLIYEKEFFNRG